LDVGLLDTNLASCVPPEDWISATQKNIRAIAHEPTMAVKLFAVRKKNAQAFTCAFFNLFFLSLPATARDFMGTGTAGGEGFWKLG
jgi:hypothetical protein